MDIVKATSKEVAVQSERLGFEEPIDTRDLIIPMAKLFQGTPTEQEEYPNAKSGQVINSLTQEVLSSKFVPVYKYTEWAKFNPRKKEDEGFDPSFEPGALIWKTTTPTPEQIRECEFGENGEKPTAVKSLRFLCYFEGQGMPLILSFSKTSYGAGKKLLSLAQFSGGNMFSRRYSITTKKEQREGNMFFVFVVTPDGIATKEEQDLCQKWYGELRGKALNVHEESVKKEEKAPGWEE